MGNHDSYSDDGASRVAGPDPRTRASASAWRRTGSKRKRPSDPSPSPTPDLFTPARVTRAVHRGRAAGRLLGLRSRAPRRGSTAPFRWRLPIGMDLLEDSLGEQGIQER